MKTKDFLYCNSVITLRKFFGKFLAKESDKALLMKNNTDAKRINRELDGFLPDDIWNIEDDNEAWNELLEHPDAFSDVFGFTVSKRSA